MLIAKQVDAARPNDKNYKLSDKDGLFLFVKTSGSKLWQYNYRLNGRQLTYSYGAYPKLSLADARAAHNAVRELLSQGLDPRVSQSSKTPTFRDIAERWFKKKDSRWTYEHGQRVWRSLELNVLPWLGNMPIDGIRRLDIVPVLDAVESRGVGEIAHRVAQRIGAVFDHAVDLGIIESSPAQRVSRVLKPQPQVVHRAAVDKDKLPELLTAIQMYDGEDITRIGLMLALHLFVRPSELVHLRWDYLVDGRVFVIPEEIMKMPFPHVVPLTPQSHALIEALRVINGKHPFLFAATRNPRKPITTNALLFALYRMGYKDKQTVHGFRAIASTILNESGLWLPDAIERQLAHKETDEVRIAYNRAKYFDERVKMMHWWSDFLDQQTSPLTNQLTDKPATKH